MPAFEQAELQGIISQALIDGMFADDRATIGDVAVGAKIAGADNSQAFEVARHVHTSDELRADVAAVGGLLVGAREFIESTTGEING